MTSRNLGHFLTPLLCHAFYYWGLRAVVTKSLTPSSSPFDRDVIYGRTQSRFSSVYFWFLPNNPFSIRSVVSNLVAIRHKWRQAVVMFNKPYFTQIVKFTMQSGDGKKLVGHHCIRCCSDGKITLFTLFYTTLLTHFSFLTHFWMDNNTF